MSIYLPRRSVIARWRKNGWDEPCKSRGLRTVLREARGEIPRAYLPGRDDQRQEARVLITDKLKSYAAANRDLGLNVDHRQHKGLNNRAENWHQPTRVREKVMLDRLAE